MPLLIFLLFQKFPCLSSLGQPSECYPIVGLASDTHPKNWWEFDYLEPTGHWALPLDIPSNLSAESSHRG
jgi:hypothetical protein